MTTTVWQWGLGGLVIGVTGARVHPARLPPIDHSLGFHFCDPVAGARTLTYSPLDPCWR